VPSCPRPKRPISTADHRGGARGRPGREDLHADPAHRPAGAQPGCVAPSAVKSRIGAPYAERAGRGRHQKQLADFANCAALARRRAMTAWRSSARPGTCCPPSWCRRPTCAPTAWGGPFENRMRFPVEVIRRVRAAVGPDFILIFRISAMDMLEGGLAWDEIVTLAQAVQAAGANILSTHFCWHEAPVPTIATMVPRAAFASVTGRLRKAPDGADDHQQPHQHARGGRIGAGPRRCRPGVDGAADAGRPRPGVNKAREGREDEINTCIACNQACLDHTFGGYKQVSCLVNPRACNETLLNYLPTAKRQAHRGGGRRPGRPGLCHGGGAARPCGDAVRRRQRDRRAVQPGQAHPGQGGVPRDAALLPHHDRSARHRRCG
jgi:2,4-dienoyl-CoA reductase (NADPH2)